MKITRLLLLTSIVSLLVSPVVELTAIAQPAAKPQGATVDQSASAKAYVKQFYDWYLPPANKRKDGEPNSSTALKNKNFSFSPELTKALTDDEAASAKNSDEIVGLDFDPFLNAQDVSDSYQTGKAVQKGDAYVVDVFAVNGGKKSTKADVMAEVKQIGGKWTFTNFLYQPSNIPVNDNLLSILKSLKADRDKAAKEEAKKSVKPKAKAKH